MAKVLFMVSLVAVHLAVVLLICGSGPVYFCVGWLTFD